MAAGLQVLLFSTCPLLWLISADSECGALTLPEYLPRLVPFLIPNVYLGSLCDLDHICSTFSMLLDSSGYSCLPL